MSQLPHPVKHVSWDGSRGRCDVCLEWRPIETFDPAWPICCVDRPEPQYIAPLTITFEEFQEQTKRCKNCKKLAWRADFAPRKGQLDGRSPNCPVCATILRERGKKNYRKVKKIRDAQDAALLASIKPLSRHVTSDEEFTRDFAYVLCDAMDLRGRSDPFAALYYQEHGTVYDLPDPDQHA